MSLQAYVCFKCIPLLKKYRMLDQKNNSNGKLRRVLTLSDLVIYGIILIQPVAALPLFGHANNISKGHAALAIRIHPSKYDYLVFID